MTTTVDYQVCREQSQIDQMDASIDKKAISDAVRAGMQEMAVLIDEEGWEYNARMNMAGYVNYWYSNLTWIQNQYDKTLQQIRELSTAPVIVLTVIDDYEIRVEGLDRGADYVMVKPIDIRELQARVTALFRRVQMTAQKCDTPKKALTYAAIDPTWPGDSWGAMCSR